MSTKIYNGLFGGEESDTDPFTLARQIREVLQGDFYDKAQALLADPASPEKTLMELSKSINKSHNSPTWTFEDADIGYDVTILEGVSCLLVLVFGENATRYTQLLVDSGVCAEFGYWDNADPEEGVTKREWEKRRREWGFALRRSGDKDFSASPAEVGLMIHHPSNMMLHMEMLRRKRENK